MKKFNLLFLVALALLFNTCKKENIKKELPLFEGDWVFHSANTELYYAAGFSSTRRIEIAKNISFDTTEYKSNFKLDDSFTIDFKKRNIVFKYDKKKYKAYLQKGAFKEHSSSRFWMLGPYWYWYLSEVNAAANFNRFNYIPNVTDIKEESNVYSIKLTYDDSELTNSNDSILIKKISAINSNSVREEYLQVFLPDILNNKMIYYPAPQSNYDGITTLIIITFKKNEK